MNCRFVFSTVVIILLVTGNPGRGQLAGDPVKHLSNELDAAPSWNGMMETNITAQGPKLMAIIRKFRPVREEDARRFVQGFLSRSQEKWKLLNASHPNDARDDAWGKIYVFNRYYFNVPEEGDVSTSPRFGGWTIPKATNPRRCKILYPLERGPGEVLSLTGRSVGYAGGAYQGLAEFDYFSKKYGPRFRLLER